MELIRVKQEGNRETVNARDLHEFLESRRDFSNWIKQRIEKYGFIEGEDFTTILAKSNGGRPGIEYHISIEMAKELSMVENNEKGRQARRYFIEREKQAKALSVPKTFAEALRLAADLEEKKQQLEQKVQEDKPKVEFYEDLVESKDLFLIGDIAKLIDCGLGRNKMMARLRLDGILMSNNIPYQRYVDAGYFKIRERGYKNRYQETRVSMTTYVTQKGVDFLRRKYK